MSAVADSQTHVGTAGRTGSEWRGWLGVLALALGCFGFVSTELSPVGLLPEIASGLHTSVGTTGLLVSAFALVVAVSAAPLTAVLGGLPRRYLMVGLLLLSTVGNVVAALAQEYWVLLIARVLVAVAIGVFWSTAAGTAVRLVPERHALRATSIVLGGLSLAAVLGVPMATAIGQHAGWHVAFAVLAGVTLIAMLASLLTLPPMRVSQVGGLRVLRQTLSHRPIWTTVAVTWLTMTGTFLLFTYVSSYLIRVADVGDGSVAPLLVLYGGAGVVGTLGVAPLITRSFERSLLAALTVVAVSLLLIWVFGTVSWAVAVLLVPWGAAYGALPVLLQTWVFRETARAEIPSEAASSLYVGSYNAAIAIGALAGSAILDGVGPRTLALVAGVVALAAVVWVAASWKLAGEAPADLHAEGARDSSRISVDGAIPLELDITSPVDVERAAEVCRDVDILIDNAGQTLLAPVMAAPDLDAARAEMETLRGSDRHRDVNRRRRS